MATSIGGLSSSLSVATQPAAAVPPPAAAAAPPVGPSAPAFTAFPASYGGFGTAGTGFGQVGITGGHLGVVSGSATSDPAPAAPAAATGSKANDPPAADPPSDPKQPLNIPPTVQTGLQAVGTIFSLASVNERLAVSYAQNQSGAVSQILPAAVDLKSQLYYQPFAGLGTSAQKPFAQPEVPAVFLSLPA
jgi:hypothetical protein